MRTELSLAGHPRPATESQDIWNDYPFGDSAATSLLSSHGYSIGAWQCPVQQCSPDRRGEGFPAPLAEDARGRVWSRYEVQAWAKRRRGEKPWR
jgi:hypothetical protein